MLHTPSLPLVAHKLLIAIAYTTLVIVSTSALVIPYFKLYTSTLLCIKTHDSESRGQEETAIIRETKNTRPLSELFTRKSVKKLTNALVKPP